MLVLLAHGRRLTSEFWALVLPLAAMGLVALIQLLLEHEPLQSLTGIGDLRRQGPIFFWSLTALVVLGVGFNAKLALRTTLSVQPPRAYWIGAAVIVVAFVVLCLTPFMPASGRESSAGPAIQFATFCPLAYLMAIDLIQRIAKR
jgi:hypothetical protein